MKMKQSIYKIFGGALLLLATACSKDEVSELIQIVEDEPSKTETVYLTACIDKEDATRATLAETGGALLSLVVIRLRFTMVQISILVQPPMPPILRLLLCQKDLKIRTMASQVSQQDW